VKTGNFELVLDVDPRLYDGRYANNGWLQELPDPITKTSWGNPLSMSPADADRLHLKNGDLVTLGKGTPLPILRQPGQADGVLRLTLGHGRWQGSVASGVGARAWTFAPEAGARVVTIAAVGPTGGRQELALSQDHDTKDGRDIARVWSLAEFARKPQHELEREELPSLYDKQEQKGPRWGMAIDLSSCVGCGGCVVACQSENNIPVVGPEQVAQGPRHALDPHRPLLREDRMATRPAWSTSPCCASTATTPPAKPCARCKPPTTAPTASTRWPTTAAWAPATAPTTARTRCAASISWISPARRPSPCSLAYNPEVTVRPRGVMEKCTFCVQRIRNATHVAKREGGFARQGRRVPACGAACPASAIVFGDMKRSQERGVQALAQQPRLPRAGRAGHQAGHHLPGRAQRIAPAGGRWTMKSAAAELPAALQPMELIEGKVTPGSPRRSGLAIPRPAATARLVPGPGRHPDGARHRRLLHRLDAVLRHRHLGQQPPGGWGFGIINFVFWVGIGHAGTLISAILFLFRARWRNAIARFAEAMTIFAVMCAGIFPVMHTWAGPGSPTGCSPTPTSAASG
jgi:Fe-S-cluster-containing dehydrogenase component